MKRLRLISAAVALYCATTAFSAAASLLVIGFAFLCLKAFQALMGLAALLEFPETLATISASVALAIGLFLFFFLGEAARRDVIEIAAKSREAKR